MRYSKRLPLFLLCSVFVLTLFLGFPAQIAHADSIPPLQWSEASLGNLAATNLVTTPSGGVMVGCGNGATNAFTTFSSTGSSTSLANSSSFDVEPCINQAAVDSNGVLYTVAYDNGSPVLAAYNGTTLAWEYSLPCGGNVGSLVVGANGKIYMTLMSGNGCSWAKLIGIEPTLASGQTTPSTDFSAYLYNGPLVTGGSLAAYNNGLIVRLTNGLSFFDYSGNEASTEPGSLNLAPHYGRQFTATMSGRVFVPVKASSNCGGDQAVVGSIDAYDPGQSTPTWSFTGLPACAYVYELHATPLGGVAAYVSTQAGNDEIVMIDSSGNEMWSVPLPAIDAYNNVFMAYAMAVDLHGDVAIQSNEQVYNTAFPSVSFTLLSENAGYPMANFLLSGDNSTYGYESAAQGNLEVSLAKDTVYLSARKCPASNNCNGDINLFAVKVAGMETDYPRGSVLGVTPNSLLRYVALGDSYASGEGVPDFMPPSDSDGCHRSYDAYPELLSQDSALPLRLTDFSACSGATTDTMQSEQDGEPAQILAIDHSVDLVTLTIGGDDIDFKGFAIACILADCSGDSLTATMGRIQNTLPGKLDALFAAIQARLSSTAKVLVVGYPRILPYDDGAFPDCIYLSSAERAGIREVITSLNADLQQAVANAGSQFAFVDADPAGSDASSPFYGHELCSDGAHFNGVSVPPEYSAHPNQAGQADYYTLIKQYLLNSWTA